MKKIFFALSLLTCISNYSQKKYSSLTTSSNNTEILNSSGRSNPNLSQKVSSNSKMSTIKGDDLMSSGKFNIKNSSDNKFTHVINNYNDSKMKTSPFSNKNEEKEFRILLAETSAAYKEKTVKLLNQLFDNDESNNKAILLIKNNGDCNMIVRIQGSEQYNLAVPARGENFVTVKKGDYRLSGNMCEARYYSAKSIAQNTMVTLNNTTLTPNRGAHLSKNTIGASN